MALLAMVLLAPPAARAGCSHLVTSRNDLSLLSSLVDPLIRDLAGPSEAPAAPPTRRPCSGAWCSGQPAAPPVPPSTFEGRLGSWAWHVGSPIGASPAHSFLAAENDVVRPRDAGDDVDRPPRPIRPA